MPTFDLRSVISRPIAHRKGIKNASDGMRTNLLLSKIQSFSRYFSAARLVLRKMCFFDKKLKFIYSGRQGLL